MNLFLVTSPFQLICAIEAKNQFQSVRNILILRLEKTLISQQQMTLLLNPDDWDHIIYLGRRSKVWELRKLISNLKKIQPNLSFQRLFYADYSAWRTAVLLNNISVEQEIMIDDGVGTIREFVDKIHPEKHVSRNKKSRDLILRLCGLNSPRVIFPRENFSFFTFFTLNDCRFPIVENQFYTLRKQLSTNTCFDANGKIGFIGQGMVAIKGIEIDVYCELLERLLMKHPKGIVYFPHRTECEMVKTRLKNIPNLEYHNSSLPLELEIGTKQIKLSALYGIASTAAVTVERIYPDIPVWDVEVPIENYVIEEFGRNFHTVSHTLNIPKIKYADLSFKE